RLEYEWVGGPIAEAFAPMLQPEEDSVVGDEGVMTPLVFLRSSTQSLALRPDVELLQRERPLPAALELDVRGRPRLAHGLVAAVRIGGAPGTPPDSFSGTRAPPAIARGETLRCSHRLSLATLASPRQALARAVATSWQERAGPELAATHRPLPAVPLE